ncbi:MAG: hypothetical protein WA917_04570 [Comamonas sp.]
MSSIRAMINDALSGLEDLFAGMYEEVVWLENLHPPSSRANNLLGNGSHGAGTVVEMKLSYR